MKIWFVAAGTGGHIYPGLCVAEEFKKKFPDVSLLFFGTSHRLEAKIIPAEGFELKTLRVSPWKGKGLLQKVFALADLSLAFFQVLLLLIKQKRPDAMLSVGGYVSVPVLLAGAMVGTPVFLVEPNIRAGLSNRLLSRFARAAFAVEGGDAETVFRCPVHKVGIPIRSQMQLIKIHEGVRKILFLGGSQGAKFLCEAAVTLAEALAKIGKKIPILLQSGAGNLEFSKNLYQSKSELKEYPFEIEPYLKDMTSVYQSVDFCISRAGASTVGELALAGMPTLFVPFPHAADNHQAINARLIESSQGAWVVEESEANPHSRIFEKVLKSCVEEGHFEQRKALSENFLKFARPKAAEDIVRIILGEIQK